MKKTFLKLAPILLITLLTACGVKSTPTDKSNALAGNYNVKSVAFYNVENLFDTIQKDKYDNEYIPSGPMKWDGLKYQAKLKNMSYAISQFGLEHTPAGASIVGVAEVENLQVLEDLVKMPSLANRTYEIVHYDSPDRRGIDVALLYNPRDFIVSSSKAYRHVSSDETFLTRDQLLVTGYLMNEKIHVIVAHWPSRWGGEAYSAPRRKEAALVTKHIVDSLYTADEHAKIIFMGDLNDDPHSPSLSVHLDAKRNMDEVPKKGLYNTMWRFLDSGIGTLVYNNQWNLFDQIIISEPLINAEQGAMRFWKAEVFNRKFLIIQEGTNKGQPHRTHSAGVWLNGYSDHFPTLIYLVKEAK